MLCMWIGRGLLHGGAMIMLCQGRRCDRDEEDTQERLHAASPSSGRTWIIVESLYSMDGDRAPIAALRSEEHTSELQSLMRISYAVFCLKQKTTHTQRIKHHTTIS